jgi:3-isopropylmalate dehydrogenase
MSSHRYTIACLAGDGVGPELMAEASRALVEVSRLHGFGITEEHFPFGGEGVVRFGHRLPRETRDGYRMADAVLVASPDDPALHAVKADLDVCWTVERVRVGRGDAVVVAPLAPECSRVAVARAFALARHRRAAVTSIGASDGWDRLVEAAASQTPGLTVEHLTLGEAVARAGRDSAGFDVVVADTLLGGAFADALATLSGTSASVARGWLPAAGPGVFAPGAVAAPEEGGFGIVNPTSMLLAAGLLLFEGLGQRPAARTLERAVEAARLERTGTPDAMEAGVGATTRDFADAVIELLPRSRTDVELMDEAA